MAEFKASFCKSEHTCFCCGKRVFHSIVNGRCFLSEVTTCPTCSRSEETGYCWACDHEQRGYVADVEEEF